MITLVAGTRPNFMKIAPVWRALRARGVDVRIVHTGQHFDTTMSDVFFHDLCLPSPDAHLRAGGGTQAEQTAAVLLGMETELLAHRPDSMVVVGDVTSTLAAALTGAKLGIPVVHVEAGLRSRDWTMPEEINRVITDRISDLLLIPSRDAAENLSAEGVEPERIVFVGNVMIDSLLSTLKQKTDVIQRMGLDEHSYAVATLHRPANVDSPASLSAVLAALEAIAQRLPVIFPVHPRTLKRAESLGLGTRMRNTARLITIEPLGYRDFATLLAGAAVVATDSGGIQEETTALGIPCLTLRGGTERPVTVVEGTNIVVGLEVNKISKEVEAILSGHGKHGRVPEGWDGRAGERCAEAIERMRAGHPAPRTTGPRA